MPQFESHLISEDEVDAWLADSAVKTVTYHCTTAGSAERILTEGIQIEQTDLRSSYGQGFCSCTIPDFRYGRFEIRVAVRLLRPLVIRDPTREAEMLDNLMARHGTDLVHEAVRAEGYDGAMIHFGPGDTWVVAYSNDQVKVVVGNGEEPA